MLCANRDNLISSFWIWMPFISFSCLIVLARTCSTMLNRNSESGHRSVIPNLRGKAFSFSLLCMILTETQGKSSLTVVLAVIFLYDIKSKSNKSKNKQAGVHQTKKLLDSKGNNQHNEKATRGMGENICKPYI